MAIVTRVAADGPDRERPIYVEVDTAPTPDGLKDMYDGIDTRENAAERVLAVARDVYGDGLELARNCARQAAGRLHDLGEGLTPDEVELQLSIKLDAELGAFLVKSGAEAQLQVTFRWTPGSAS
ncbi:HD domain-containing protein [Streptomyces sp. NBC_01288]|uniref:CU044_2847 family protein n=1 Tax=Streptomyces sp. NBC_01288 TaxID=2903814 RepID=UPI002E0FFAC1|nr:HD domain-containing protein [Streptomyces sp. NBC_01288]